MPVTGRVPTAFQPIDEIPVFILATVAEPVRNADGMIMITSRFGADFGVHAAFFALLGTAGALKDFLNRQNLPFPDERIPFILR
jgi:hypothetical protein